MRTYFWCRGDHGECYTVTPLRRFGLGSSDELCDRQLSVTVSKYLRQCTYEAERFVWAHGFSPELLALLLWVHSCTLHHSGSTGKKRASSIHGSWEAKKVRNDTGLVTHACNSSPGKDEAGRLPRVWSQSGIHSSSQYRNKMRPCLRKPNKTQHT